MHRKQEVLAGIGNIEARASEVLAAPQDPAMNELANR
jgi:hypothetical protein